MNSACSMTVLQFFSRMSRAVKSYDTAFNDTEAGRELRDGLTANPKLWSDIMAEIKSAMDVLMTLAGRADLWDLPIGQGIASSDWQILVATGESPKSTDTREKPVVSIQELGAMAWKFAEEYEEMSDIMNAVGFALREYEEVDTEWVKMQDQGPVDMNSQAVRLISHRWNEKDADLRHIRDHATIKFHVWGRTAERFGTGMHELFDNIPRYDYERYWDICKKIGSLYGACIDLLNLTAKNPFMNQWRDFFHGVAARFVEEQVMQTQGERPFVPVVS